MGSNRIPKQALRCKQKGRRNIGRPRRRWNDQLHLEGYGTGTMTNPSERMMMMMIIIICYCLRSFQ
jgi:hypothetical protein